MGDFTSFGAKIWRWRRWRGLDATTRLLWVGLYTSLQAKRLVPGLWHGSIAVVVDETGLSPEQVIKSIDRLLEVDLVEYDRDNDIIRMTELPDAGEWPSNERWLQGWWNRFCLIPQCPIRDAHVTTLRWILDEGARDRGKVVSKNVNDAWLDTFGRIEIPAQRRRGVLRLEGDSDTSTAVQPSLFGNVSPSIPELPGGRPSTTPDSSTSRTNSDPIPSPSETVSEATSEETLKRGSIDPLRGSGTGTGTGTGTLISSPGGIGGLSTGGAKPHLMLVPAPGAFTAAALHQVLRPTGARWPGTLAESDQHALAHAIGELGTMFDGPAVLELMREHVQCGGLAGITIAQVCRPGALSAAIQQAQERKRSALERSAMLADVLEG